MIEEFFKAHQHTIAAIAAAGTVGAVVTSLWLAWRARRADRTQLKAHADIVPSFDGQTTQKFLKVSIANIGKFPQYISSAFFYWKVPFRGEVTNVWPVDLLGNPFIPSKNYPFEISPRASANFYISDLPTLEREAKRMRGADTFADQVRFRFIRAFVRTDDGETFRVKLSPEVRQVWTGRV